MNVNKIHVEPKEIITDQYILSDWCTEISPKKEGNLLQEIILTLKATMRKFDLVSLTAPQIGYQRRVFCIKFGKNDYRTFINPMIDNNYNFQFSREKCSSIPEKTFIYPRFGKVHAFFTTPTDKVETTTLVGRSAIVFQHCIDHLNGVLLSDIGLEIDEQWDLATDDERAEVLKMYAESLDIKQKKLEKEINNDEEAKKINDASKFINSVKDGKTTLDNSLDENSKDEE